MRTRCSHVNKGHTDLVSRLVSNPAVHKPYHRQWKGNHTHPLIPDQPPTRLYNLTRTAFPYRIKVEQLFHYESRQAR
jgi:hypothetical protein